MKLFLVKVNSYYYDDYDSKVVRAENETEALLICGEESWTIDNTKITEITIDGEKQIILGSFNAG